MTYRFSKAVILVGLPVASCSLAMKDLPSDPPVAAVDEDAGDSATAEDAVGSNADADASAGDIGAGDSAEGSADDGGIDAPAHPEPEVLAQGQDGPIDIAVDDTYVYWVNVAVGAEGTATRVPIAGGEPKVFAEGLFFPTRIVKQGPDLFLMMRDCGLFIVQNGDTLHELSTSMVDVDCWGLGVASASVFTATMHSVERFPLPSGPYQTWAANEHDAISLVVSGDDVFWGNGAPGGAIRKAPVSTGVAETLAIGQGDVMGLTADSTHVYWTSNSHGTVNRIARGGGDVETIASGELGPAGIAVDGTHAYWVDRGDMNTSSSGGVFRAPIGGGARETLAVNQWEPERVVVTQTHVYWVAYGSATYASGRVMRVAK